MAETNRDDPSNPSDPTLWGRLAAAALSLPCKVMVFVVVLVVTITAGVAGYLLHSSIELNRVHHHHQLAQLGAVLARAAAPTLAERNTAALSMLARKSANGDPLLYVVFYDVDFSELVAEELHQAGRLSKLRTSRPLDDAVRGIPEVLQSVRSSEPLLDVMYPVTSYEANLPGNGHPNSRLLGYVRIGMTAAGWSRMLGSRLDILIGLGTLVAVLAIPLGFLLVRRVISPLEALNEVMVRFSHGQWEVRSEVTRRDEIGRLAGTFNRMADLHQETHERIVKLNNQLEERVALRTQQLRELASREPLTGLYNRRYFNEVLDQQISEAIRYNGELSCVMIDLDDFKQVNDRFGHHTGDDVLLLATATIQSELRAADVAARFGGDEFILLLPHTSSESALVMAERLAEQFDGDLARQMPTVRTAMSFGIGCVRPGEPCDAETLLRSADRDLYRAKAAKRAKATASRVPATAKA